MRNENIEKFMPTYILLRITASSAVSLHLLFLPFMTDYRYQETPTRKIPTQEIPTNQTLFWWIPPGKLPPRKFPSGIFPPIFLNIPIDFFNFFFFFHYCHRYHWYYLEDCFLFLCLKSAEIRLVAVYQKIIVACRPRWLHTQKGFAGQLW